MKNSLTKVLSYIFPRLQDVFFIAIFISVIGFGPKLMNIDGDLGRHITIGKYILAERKIPTVDVFSHTMKGQPLTPHEWLSQVIFAFAYQLAGFNGVVFLCALIISLSFLGVLRRSIKTSDLLFFGILWTLIGAGASSLHWLTRPHIFTFLMTVLWVGVLDPQENKTSRHWWWLPVLMVFWVNLHGAFIAGFVIMGAHLAGIVWNIFSQRGISSSSGIHHNLELNRLKHILWFGMICFIVTGLNPKGFDIWKTSLGYIQNKYLVGHTAEYLPPNFHDPSTWPFLLMISVSIFLLGLNRKNNLHPTNLFLLVGWTTMGLYSTRNVPLYAIISAPILAQLTRDFFQTDRVFTPVLRFENRLRKTDRKINGGALPIVFVLLVALAFNDNYHFLDFGGSGNQFDPEIFPVDAVNWIVSNPQSGNIFNYFPWGGYLLYRLWPQELVFIDGQTDFYGENLTREYEQIITNQPGTPDLLSKYQVSWALLPRDTLIAKSLKNDLDWTMVYEDKVAVILVR